MTHMTRMNRMNRMNCMTRMNRIFAAGRTRRFGRAHDIAETNPGRGSADRCDRRMVVQRGDDCDSTEHVNECPNCARCIGPPQCSRNASVVDCEHYDRGNRGQQ
jgi:hypothetical protein